MNNIEDIDLSILNTEELNELLGIFEGMRDALDSNKKEEK